MILQLNLSYWRHPRACASVNETRSGTGTNENTNQQQAVAPQQHTGTASALYPRDQRVMAEKLPLGPVWTCSGCAHNLSASTAHARFSRLTTSSLLPACTRTHTLTCTRITSRTTSHQPRSVVARCRPLPQKRCFAQSTVSRNCRAKLHSRHTSSSSTSSELLGGSSKLAACWSMSSAPSEARSGTESVR
jgi:hypothetical protein